MSETNNSNEVVVSIKNLQKAFGDNVVLRDIDLDVHKGEVVVVLGPSGSGKSTMLRCINRLEEPTSGSIVVEGVDVCAKGVDLNKVRTHLGMVFQQFNLFPHLSVKKNVMLAQQKVLKRSKEEAEKIAEEKGFIFVEDAGRGYRRVVPSPIPKRIVELNVVDQLVRAGDIVITVGGGGIPVVETEDGLRGVAAVIDKDRASSLLAQDVRADRLIILTAVDAVCVNYNKPDQKELSSMTIAECEKYIAEGQFAPGSMLPKVESCMEFVKNNDHGGTALITSLARAADALEGKTGTVITR